MSEINWEREENKRLDQILLARFQDLTRLENTIGYYWANADDKENARKAVTELETLETNCNNALKANVELAKLNTDLQERNQWWCETYDMTMPCGHLARYAVNEKEGTQYCALCVLDSTQVTIANLILADVDETDEKCPFCKTRAILKHVEHLLEFTPEIGAKHYDDVIANLINDVTSANSTFQCYCEENKNE